MLGITPRPVRAARTRPTTIAGACAALATALLTVALPATAAAAPSSAAASAAAFEDVSGIANRPTAAREINPERFRSLAVDRNALADVLADAPRANAGAPLLVSLPAPGGGFRRFAIRRSSVMEAALAAAHPEIATYSGTGVDDPGTTVAIDLTPLGLHASVRGPNGNWYVDPLYRASQSVYASYRGSDLDVNPHGSLSENDFPGFSAAAREPSIATAPGGVVTLRTYRLALLSDPGYAAYFGTANVIAAKVTLINRVNQIYEADLAIHLTLVANTGALNFDTDAKMTGADGPCGSAACYTAAQAGGCESETLDRTRTVIGQLVGASNFDVGHIALAAGGGGLAGLGVVGGDRKAEGCTGVSTPVGDLYAVDYVAHELGHQFGGPHTFNGIDGSCAGNISGSAVEPGSGVTIMAYAGICGTDNLQAHSDPYFSQRTIDEATAYVNAPLPTVNEVQTVSLRDFSGTDSFKLVYGANQSVTITRGVNYTSAGIEAAIEAITGVSGTIVLIDRWDGSSGQPDDRGFAVTFGGTLAGVDASPLSLTGLSGVTGFVGETTQGGASANGGTATAPGNHSPVVTAPPAATIPTRTPFSLTGSATDADGDTPTYLWEQNDVGSGTALYSNTKPNGPLFRVFGTTAIVTDPDSLTSPSPGENTAGTDPTRVFPDLAQVVAGTTNAATGSCPAPAGDPVPPATIDCYSEFLPTSVYGNPLHLRLTARDGHVGVGGVSHADTTLTVAPAAGPFRVTSQAAAATVPASGPLTVTWSVAGTNAAPISTANVKITLSTDGGLTFPTVLAASTPNDGSEGVTLPAGTAAHARIKVEAVGNVYFDVSHGDLTIGPAGGSTYVAAVTADTPRGYWRMGEPSGTTLTDSSPNANNGIYQNGVLLGQAGALVGDANTAAKFDGVNDMGRVNDAASLDVGASLSVEGWIKRSAATASMELMNKGGNGLQLVVMNAASGNQVFLRKANVTTIARSASGIPADGNYHHVVATTTGAAGGATIYIDGVASTVQVSPGTQLADTAFALTFGSSASNATNFDEFALYDQTLAAVRVSAHYAAGTGV